MCRYCEPDAYGGYEALEEDSRGTVRYDGEGHLVVELYEFYGPGECAFEYTVPVSYCPACGDEL